MNEAHPVHPALVGAIEARGFTTLTDVQIAVSSPDFAGKDLLVSARTGSGKTVAFGLAIAESLLDEKSNAPLIGPHAIVIAPTRELALQVHKELIWLYADTGLKIGSAVGGMDPRAERKALERGLHILVGTPGRLVDHLNRHSLDLADIRAVILDEADEMLDLGFREDLEILLDAMPQTRRTLMFSATVSKPIATMAKRYQRDAIRVEAGGAGEPHKDITYSGVLISPSDREKAIINVLRFHDDASAIIFCATRATVAYMSARFANRGLQVVSLSGELNQAARNQALQSMRDGRARICVATDVAARGIDLPDLELVIHADIPKTSETLLHRSGRTGRAGRKGHSILMVPQNSFRKTQRLLQIVGIQAEFAPAPDADTIRARDDERILTHETLTQPAQEDETTLINALVEKHSPAEIAAALVRAHRASYSAPEELNEISASRRDEEPMDVQWISLSVGRKEDVQVRFILAMLTRHGDLNRKDIGHIRLHHAESHIAIAKSAVASFKAAIGPKSTLGDDISVVMLDGPPADSRCPRDSNRPKKFSRDRDEGRRGGGGGGGDRKDWGDRKDRGERKDRGDRKDWGDRKERGERKEWGDRPPRRADDRPSDDRKPKRWSPEDKQQDGGSSKKPFRAKSGPPRSDGKPAGKPFGKPGGKPFGKPAGKPARAASHDDAGGSTLSLAGKKRKGKPAGQGGGGPIKRRQS